MRYLGLSLGMAIALGRTTAFGTLVPPLFDGTFAAKLLATTSGHVILAGIVVILAGIGVVALAGRAKEAEMSVAQRQATISEFDLKKGVAVAVFSGVMSSCFAFGLAAGEPIRQLSLAHGAGPLRQGLPALCVVLLGGLTTNLAWCAGLIVKNRSAGQWIGKGMEGRQRQDPRPGDRRHRRAGALHRRHRPRQRPGDVAAGATRLNVRPARMSKTMPGAMRVSLARASPSIRCLCGVRSTSRSSLPV